MSSRFEELDWQQTPLGLRTLADQLHPGGVFALWSDDPPDEDFLSVPDEVFPAATAHVVAFPNPHTSGTSTNTVYVATVAAADTRPGSG